MVLQEVATCPAGQELLCHLATAFGYPGVFILSLIGASSIIFPIPYTLILFYVAAPPISLDPVPLALTAGAGAALGELTGYALGYYGQRLIGERRKRRMAPLVRLLEKYGPVVIFLFALLPLPDDLLFIPLGILRYNFFRFFIPTIIGKTVSAYVIALSGQLSITYINDFFGGASQYSLIITTVLLVALVIVLLKTDWEKLLTRYGFLERANPSQDGERI